MSDPRPIGADGRGRGPGRPTRADVASTCRTEFVLTVTEREALKQVAEHEKKPVASVIREAVNSFVADYSDKRIFRY